MDNNGAKGYGNHSNGANGNHGNGGGNNGNIDLDLRLGPADNCNGGGNNRNVDLDLHLGRDPIHYPWSTGAPARIHTLDELRARGVASVEGETVCRQCEQRTHVEYPLHANFNLVADFLRREGHDLNDRAPPRWAQPALSNCEACGGVGCVRPVVAEEGEDINWLFLFLGEKLGLCKIQQLRWFCQQTANYCSGNKDRLLYLVYLDICWQLRPARWLRVLGGWP